MASSTLIGSSMMTLADLAAERFADVFYATFDARRSHLLSGFFRENSRLIWQGHPAVTLQQLQALMAMLPGSKHTIHTLDAHELAGSSNFNPQSSQQFSGTLLIIVTGTVQWGADPRQHGFHHQFLLEQDNQSSMHYIVQGCLRTRQLPQKQATHSAGFSGRSGGITEIATRSGRTVSVRAGR